MTKDEVCDLLQANGFSVTQEGRLPNDAGWQLRCAGGEIVAIYDTGKVVAQGKNQDQIKALFGQTLPAPKSASHVNCSSVTVAPRNVFVVYGHDSSARTELEAMLRRWGLNPLILDQLASEGKTIIEKLENAQGQANYAVVLATPDDEGHRKEHPDEKQFRARQNVVLELGMMLAKLGRDRVAVLLKGQANMERPSDIQGLIYIPFKDNVQEAALTLAKEINAKGIPIDLNKV
ncbi:MAG: nucleotide-binding protein [Rhodospirillales bacterium]|nr:nucleotide-binding protein [Rhodospirillales bacterium]